MKKYKITKIIYSIIISYIMVLSVGYALFNEALTINGVASTVEYYDAAMLPVEAIAVIDNEDKINLYHSVENCPNWLEFSSENWEDDTYEINYYKNNNHIETNSGTITTNFTFSFSNPTVLEYTNGKTITEIIDNKSGMIQSASTSISSINVKPGQPVTITLSITTKPIVSLETEKIKVTISYVFQGKLRTLYFIVNYKV